MNTPKAGIYTRVSTGEQAETGTSMEAQEFGCLRKAAEISAQVVAIYRDAGVSGTRFLTRPGIQEALGDLRTGKIDTLIIYKLDRAGRDVDVIRTIKKEVEAVGGRLVFADGVNFEKSAVGNFTFNTFANVAELEKELIRERTMSGRTRRAEEGVQPARSWSPYGYHIISKQDILQGLYPADRLGQYEIVEEQARYVREIFTRYAAGSSLRQVCIWMQKQGVLTPRNTREWWPGTIKTIMENPVYKGAAPYNRHERRIDETRRQRGFSSVAYNVKRPEAQWIAIPAPAIVSIMLWDMCRARLTENRVARSGNPKRRYLLSGLLRCPLCRRAMSGHTIPNGYKRAKRRYYICRDYCPSCNMVGRVCNKKHYPAEQLEAAVLNTIANMARQPERFESALLAYYRRSNAGDMAQEQARLQQELKALEAQEKATVSAQIAGIQAGAKPEHYAEQFAAIAQKRGDIETQLAALGKVEPREEPKDRAARIAYVLQEVEEALQTPELETAERYEILRSILRIVIPEQEEKCRLYLREGAETVQSISIFWSG